MLNFTEEIKKEIASSNFSDEHEALAVLSAFIKTSGGVVYRGNEYGFEIVTENEITAECITNIIESIFNFPLTVAGAKSDVLSGRDKLTLECVSSNSFQLLTRLGLIKSQNGKVEERKGIYENLVTNENLKAAYIKGAFLGGGSCTLPDEQTLSRTGYHFEIKFFDKFAAADFCELLCDFEILAKLVSRKNDHVVYVKSKEVISDILNIISTEKCLEKLNKVVELKDKTNNANRANNCSVSNIDKTVTASVNQVKAIEIISATIGLQRLNNLLFEVAEARLADKNASMQELADRLNITKSCINHRMRKILGIAKTLDRD